MVLVNGAEGIGTGWSTTIPNFNPKDIVANLRRLMDGEPQEPMHPWYRGFKGAITEVPTKSLSRAYTCSGTIAQVGVEVKRRGAVRRWPGGCHCRDRDPVLAWVVRSDFLFRDLYSSVMPRVPVSTCATVHPAPSSCWDLAAIRKAELLSAQRLLLLFLLLITCESQLYL